MKCLLSHSNDPFFNLAAEEYLLKNYTDDIYFQYVNDNAVVIGKHQNALAEIDLDYLQENEITLARRISGGGAVYHDKGNLNYSFLTNERPGDFIQFAKYTAPVIAALSELGLNAFMGKRNEILAGERKISGTASHVFKTRVLHHGTLLFSADLKKLSRCLYVDAGRYSDKAVKSVRSEVTNLEGLISPKMEMASFYSFIFNYLLENLPDGQSMEFTASDLEQIARLREEKFVTWEWNYGYSPNYELERELVAGEERIMVRTIVRKGVIQEVFFNGTDDDERLIINEALQGTIHRKPQINAKLKEIIPDEKYRAMILGVLF